MELLSYERSDLNLLWLVVADYNCNLRMLREVAAEDDVRSTEVDDMIERMQSLCDRVGSLAERIEAALEGQASTAVASLLAGAGQSPAVKGHGCPASSDAVGSAPASPAPAGVLRSSAAGVDITNPDDPLFYNSSLQELPVAIGTVNIDPWGV